MHSLVCIIFLPHPLLHKSQNQGPCYSATDFYRKQTVFQLRTLQGAYRLEFDDADSLIQLKLLATGTFGSVCMEGSRSKTGLDLKSGLSLPLPLPLPCTAAFQHLYLSVLLKINFVFPVFHMVSHIYFLKC